MRILLAALLVLLFNSPGKASAQESDPLDISVSELIGLKSQIAAKKAATRIEAPGIVTYVTREEILSSGARDLREILAFYVPGYAFAYDAYNAVGVSVRGLWGNEGKVLLMMDGVPLNEEVYSTNQFGNHYPAEMIERVEVIRGPGSAIYGGYALIGVINMITTHPKQSGYSVAARYSQMSKTYSHRNLSAVTSYVRDDLDVSLLAITGQGHRSQRDYVDVAGVSKNLADSNPTDPRLFNLGLKKGAFDLRVIYDRYNTEHANLFSTFSTDLHTMAETFESRNVKASYTYKLSETFDVTPSYMYRETRPWQASDPDPDPSSSYQFTKYTMRNTLALDSAWHLSDATEWHNGVEYSNLRLRILDPNVDDFFARYSGEGGIFEDFYVYYTEFSTATGLGNLTLGARYEYSTQHPAAFVPRLGLTKAWEKWHYKLMAARSFRALSGLHNDFRKAGTQLKPEFATNYELEIGYRFSERLFASVNFFDIHIDNPVVYLSDPASLLGDSYRNENSLGSTGAETELRYRDSRFELLHTISYYTRTRSTDTTYRVPDDENAFLAFANWRSNLLLGYRFTPRLGAYLRGEYFGERRGFTGNGAGGTVIREFDSQFVAGANVVLQNFGLEGLRMTLGVTNLGDAPLDLPQAYNGDFAPLPDLSRAVNAMVSYEASY